jgi:methylphosphotriester-DNA--protein-cysteine methyltransferase
MTRRRAVLGLLALVLSVAACDLRYRHAVGPDQGKFVASRRGERYHTLDCRLAKRIHRRQVLYYRTGDDAYRDGFLPCRVCHPEKGSEPQPQP